MLPKTEEVRTASGKRLVLAGTVFVCFSLLVFGSSTLEAPASPLRRLTNLRETTASTPEPLDFFIAGFEKCGTSYLKDVLKRHNETGMMPHEDCEINRHSQHIDSPSVYNNLQEKLSQLDPGTIRGIKCPRLIRNEHALQRLGRWYPQTKILVAVRHPVHWLRSYYNYRVSKVYSGHFNVSIAPLETLVGSNEWLDVSTDAARFEYDLHKLGKTPRPLDDRVFKQTPFQVLVYSLAQVSDPNETRRLEFASKISEFLGLEQPLNLKPHSSITIANYTESVDICKDQYQSIRALLVQQGERTVQWIRDEFIRSPDVKVINEEHFLDTLDDWEMDPCVADESVL